MNIPPRISSFLFKWLQAQVQPVNNLQTKAWLTLQQINAAFLRDAPQKESLNVDDISFFLENQKWNQLIWGTNIASATDPKVFSVRLKPLGGVKNQCKEPTNKTLPVEWRELKDVGPISIIWDWENLGLGQNELVPGVTKIKSYFGPRGTIQNFMAAANLSQMAEKTRTALFNLGVRFSDVPATGIADASDYFLQIEIMRIMLACPPPHTFVIMTCDKDFVPMMRLLITKGYYVVWVGKKWTQAFEDSCHVPLNWSFFQAAGPVVPEATEKRPDSNVQNPILIIDSSPAKPTKQPTTPTPTPASNSNTKKQTPPQQPPQPKTNNNNLKNNQTSPTPNPTASNNNKNNQTTPTPNSTASNSKAPGATSKAQSPPSPSPTTSKQPPPSQPQPPPPDTPKATMSVFPPPNVASASLFPPSITRTQQGGKPPATGTQFGTTNAFAASISKAPNSPPPKSQTPVQAPPPKPQTQLIPSKPRQDSPKRNSPAPPSGSPSSGQQPSNNNLRASGAGNRTAETNKLEEIPNNDYSIYLANAHWVEIKNWNTANISKLTIDSWIFIPAGGFGSGRIWTKEICFAVGCTGDYRLSVGFNNAEEMVSLMRIIYSFKQSLRVYKWEMCCIRAIPPTIYERKASIKNRFPSIACGLPTRASDFQFPIAGKESPKRAILRHDKKHMVVVGFIQEGEITWVQKQTTKKSPKNVTVT